MNNNNNNKRMREQQIITKSFNLNESEIYKTFLLNTSRKRINNNNNNNGDSNNNNNNNNNYNNCKKLNSNLTLCSFKCGCFKNGNKCNESCHCKGVCGNGKSISDQLFFKVWRNIVIRRNITGEYRLLRIKRMDETKLKVLEKFKQLQIEYRNETVDQLLANTDDDGVEKYSIDYIVDCEISNLKQERKNQLLELLSVEKIKFRSKNQLFNDFINSYSKPLQAKLPSIQIIIESERQYQSRKQLLSNELLKYDYQYYRKGNLQFKQYLVNGEQQPNTLQKLVSDEIELLSNKNNSILRRELIFYSLLKNGFNEIIGNQDMVDYINGNSKLTFSKALQKQIQFHNTMEGLRCIHCGNIH